MAYDGAMRTLFVLACLALAACGAETTSSSADAGPDVAADAPAPAVDAASDVPAPPDAPPTPCGGACWPGTVCEAGRCVPVDAGVPDVTAEAAVDVAPSDALADVPPDALACPIRSANCDGDASNGCETNSDTDNTHCGMCGRACPAASVCSNGTCGARCAAGYAMCAGRCTNAAFDRENCGMCGRSCPAGQVCDMFACR